MQRMQRLFIARSWYLGSDSRLLCMNCVYKTGLSRNIMTDKESQKIIVTDEEIQKMYESIMNWAQAQGLNSFTAREYKTHFEDIKHWEKTCRKKLLQLIEKPPIIATDEEIQKMSESIIIWANNKHVNVENVTHNDDPSFYGAHFDEIKGWDGKSQEKLSDSLLKWLKDEDPKARKNRRGRNSRHANKIAEGKKDRVELTPEEAAAKKAAAKEHKNKRARENREKIKKISERVKTLNSVLNPYLHWLLKRLAEPEDDNIPDYILLQDLLGLAQDHNYPSIDRKDYQEWISERLECFKPHIELTTRFMVEKFPTSDKDLENVQTLMQQVSASTSTPGNVFANPTARAGNVSDSSCDSDGNVSNSSCDSDDSGSDEDAPVAKKARVPGAGGSYSKDKSPLSTPGTPPTPVTPPTPLGFPVTPGGPYSRSVSRSPLAW